MMKSHTLLETMTALRLCLMGRLDSCLECPYRDDGSTFFKTCSDQLYFDVQQHVLMSADQQQSADQLTIQN